MQHIFQGWRHKEIIAVLFIGVVSIVLWRVPMLGILFYPFQLFNTFIHELSHGLAAILTGGQFVQFAVNPDLSGVAWSAGGIRWVVTSAGYVGAALFGGFLTILSARGAPANTVLVFLGIGLGILCLIFVRNLFGIVSGLILATLLVLAGKYLRPLWADGLLLVLAVQAMLNAIDSLMDLFWLSTRSSTMTDALIMQEQTGIPAVIWALVWGALSLGILAGSLTLAYRNDPNALRPQPVSMGSQSR